MASNLELKVVPSQSAIACNLQGTAQFQQREEEARQLFSQCRAVEELSAGYSFKFESSLEQINTLTAFITAERECCPFFTMALLFEPDGGPIWLQIQGAAGTKEELLPLVELAARGN